MKTLSLLFLTVLLSATPPAPWCRHVLQHGETARDLRGNLYVMDGWQLRRFAYNPLRYWYQTSTEPACILSRLSAAQYQYGPDIDFRPDQDFHNPVFFRPKKSKNTYIWYRGRIHRLEVPTSHLKIKDRHIYQVSRLITDSLPEGTTITKRTILEGTVIRYAKGLEFKTFIFTRNGLRPIDEAYLNRLDLSPRPALTITSSDLKRLSVGPLFKLLNRSILPSNILIRGSHPKRLYLLKNGKRHYFWSEQALTSRELQHQAIIQLNDDELYLIPYAGNLY